MQKLELEMAPEPMSSYQRQIELDHNFDHWSAGGEVPMAGIGDVTEVQRPSSDMREVT